MTVRTSLQELLTDYQNDPSGRTWPVLVEHAHSLLEEVVNSATNRHLSRWTADGYTNRRWGANSAEDLRQQMWENALISLKEAAGSWDGHSDPEAHIRRVAVGRTRTVDYETMGRYTRESEVKNLAARQIREQQVTGDLVSSVRDELVNRRVRKGMDEEAARASLVKDGYEAILRNGAATLAAAAPLSLDRPDENGDHIDLPDTELAEGTEDVLPAAATLSVMSRVAFGTSDTNNSMLLAVLDGTATSREARRQIRLAAQRLGSPHCQWAHLAVGVKDRYEHPVQHRDPLQVIRSRKRRNGVARSGGHRTVENLTGSLNR